MWHREGAAGIRTGAGASGWGRWAREVVDLGGWVRLCGAEEAPGEGAVMEAAAEGVEVCLARVGGDLRALDNLCPHRLGPLGQGWVEGVAVVCPWHSWAFDVCTGVAAYPEGASVAVYRVRVEGGEVEVELPDGVQTRGERSASG